MSPQLGQCISIHFDGDLPKPRPAALCNLHLARDERVRTKYSLPRPHASEIQVVSQCQPPSQPPNRKVQNAFRKSKLNIPFSSSNYILQSILHF